MNKFVSLHGFGGSGGGIELNFEVVGGITQPENPSENTIWINTDIELSGYSFGVETPVEPIEGMAWIHIGVVSACSFNALKENAINIYPTMCQQYVSGSWLSKTAKIYSNSIWQDWCLYLISKGNLHEDVTGGWVSSHYSFTQQSNGSFYFYRSSSTNAPLHTVNSIDLSSWSTLTLTYHGLTSSGTLAVYLTGHTSIKTLSKATSGTILLDLTNVNYSDTISISPYANQAVYIDEIKLEI